MEARIVTDNVRDTSPLKACQVCGQGFGSRRREARYCSQACTQRAYRLRHQQPSTLPSLPKRLAMDHKIYECPTCTTRYQGEQRCDQCRVFCRLVGPGGECPHCGELIAVADLGLPEAVSR